MSRNAIIALGGLLWGGFIADAVVHFGTGDWAAPTVAALVGATWIVVRRSRARQAVTA
jgi:outer membrane lipoprotein SlyB